jgi:hypothetical protein
MICEICLQEDVELDECPFCGSEMCCECLIIHLDECEQNPDVNDDI